MAVELHILFGGKLPSKAVLNRALKELGFPVAIPAGGGALEQHSGFLPMTLRRQQSGVEFDVRNDRADIAEVAGEDVGARFERLASFRWGGDEREMLCALCTAAALAKLVDGVVLDDDGAHLSVDQAIEQARKTLNLVKPPDPRYGTRPADIRRYLKPLLELRSDLMVVGRMLLIRPVRHLLRGALFERTSDKYRFEVRQYIQPVFGLPNGCGHGDCIVGWWEVWQPHFVPLLMDCLATEAFDRWAPVTTLDELATKVIASGKDSLAAITYLALAGEWDRASEYIQWLEHEFSHEGFKAEIRALWKRVTTDIDGFCAELHAKEAETIKALKLDRVWEPSPFPVELPPAERISRSAERAFTTDPWVPPPSGLWQEFPTEPGDVRFAKQLHWRDGRWLLLVILSREEAEQRHRDCEEYFMAARLRDGLLLIIQFSGRDRNNPEVSQCAPTGWPSTPSFISLLGSSNALIVQASDWKHPGFLDLWSIEVVERLRGESRWVCYIKPEEDEKLIYDKRAGDVPPVRSVLTPTEHELAMCPIPAFGEYEDLVARCRVLLRAVGYDDVT
jgi:hypothetical protein